MHTNDPKWSQIILFQRISFLKPSPLFRILSKSPLLYSRVNSSGSVLCQPGLIVYWHNQNHSYVITCQMFPQMRSEHKFKFGGNYSVGLASNTADSFNKRTKNLFKTELNSFSNLIVLDRTKTVLRLPLVAFCWSEYFLRMQ